MSKLLASVCLTAAAVALAACNDNISSSPTASTAPTPAPNPSPSPTGCTQVTTRSLARDVLDSTPFTTTSSGRVDITVDWKNAQANVGAFLVQAGTCSPQRFSKAGACTFLAESGTDKPHQMSANLPAGSYELLLDYFGAGAMASNAPSETATVQIVQSTGCPAS